MLKEKRPFYRKTNFYLILVFLLIIFSLFSPLIFTSFYSGFDFTETGQIGDTIGGVMNPFVAIAGVIVTYLAFKMQFNANQNLKKELEEQITASRKQQIERQFYEMLRLYKENVNEISINLYKLDQETLRKLPLNKFTVNNINYNLELDFTMNGRKVFSSFIEEIKYVYILILMRAEKKVTPGKIVPKSKEYLKLAYKCFFNGTDMVYNLKNAEYANQLEGIFDGINSNEFIGSRTKFGLNRDLFNGQSNYLGHYFRHLYHTVKFIANNTNLSEPEKVSYLKILRSQISNEEQVLLFYNYVSGYGKKWENENQKYFSQYKMIHNLDNSMLIDEFKLEDFFKEQMNITKNMFDFQTLK
tara:strand:+ start:101 stop:1171 length:1071 start_codon:yes stop_codon:yes gene_type:complete